ncbi:hypothetical protein [Pseudonocardia humida]|uniref:Uncharacterized protein n=1 Tax=Pseudonocardia humida TaxID=2800819 RepID=A0ABT0ZSE1_9PSEU|nr:hypothetical protein [Pseudonocardia humida]MCO1653615.1 hypothetical protein [Pseudonocardia humida]
MPPVPPPSTQAVIELVRSTAARHGRRVEVDEDIGDDVTRAGMDGPTPAADAAFFSHEAFLEVSGVPPIAVEVGDRDDVVVTVDGVALDVPRDRVRDVLEAVWGGRAWVRDPAAPVLCVSVPGDETYTEAVLVWTPWLMRVARTRPSRLGALLRRLTGRDGGAR